MSKTLVLADRHAITAAKKLNAIIEVLVLGSESEARDYAQMSGVSKVWYTDDPLYAQGLAENTAALIHSMADNYEKIVGVANTMMKNILPRVSGLLDWPLIAEVIEIIDPVTFVRPIYAGNALQKIKVKASHFILTIRSANFEPEQATQEAAPIEKLTLRCDTGLSEFIKIEQSVSERPELTNAKIIVSGGRGLQDKANFALLEKLADTLHAAVGASRAAVDAGWVPNDYQIGQTGKIVAPDLYLAIGISGAIQHIAGMKDSKVIVAINKDPEAPIFKIADYGLVADLFEAIPQMEKALHEH